MSICRFAENSFYIVSLDALNSERFVIRGHSQSTAKSNNRPKNRKHEARILIVTTSNCAQAEHSFDKVSLEVLNVSTI